MQHQGVIFPQAQLNSTMLLANSHGQCSNIVKYWEPKIKFLKNFVQLLSYNYYAKTIVLIGTIGLFVTRTFIN